MNLYCAVRVQAYRRTILTALATNYLAYYIVRKIRRIERIDKSIAFQQLVEL